MPELSLNYKVQGTNYKVQITYIELKKVKPTTSGTI